MNIVMVSPFPYSTVKTGGWEAASHALMTALHRTYEDIHLHVVDVRPVVRYETFDVADRWTVHRMPLHGALMNLRQGYPERGAIVRAIRQMRPDIVHCQNPGMGAAIGIQAHPRTVVSIHGIGPIENAITHGTTPPFRIRFRQYMNARRDARILAKATGVHMVSRFAAQYYSAFTDKITVIPNTVSEIFDGKGINRERSNVILIVGHISPVKNSITAVDWLERSRAIHEGYAIVMAGGFLCDQQYQEEFLARVNASPLGSRLRYVNALPDEELASYYRQAKLILSFSRQENNPLALIQALGMSIPIVAPRVGGIPEIVSDDCTGYLYESGSYDSFASSLERALAPDNADRLRAQCYPVFHQRYSIDAVVSQYRALYTRLGTAR